MKGPSVALRAKESHGFQVENNRKRARGKASIQKAAIPEKGPAG
jgi:hypothetical protein